MTQEERWMVRYKEVVEFIKANHRNPSKHRIEEHNMLNWLKANRKSLNAGKMKVERVEKLTIVDFRHDSTMFERTRHCARCSESLENFWKCAKDIRELTSMSDPITSIPFSREHALGSLISPNPLLL